MELILNDKDYDDFIYDTFICKSDCVHRFDCVMHRSFDMATFNPVHPTITTTNKFDMIQIRCKNATPEDK